MTYRLDHPKPHDILKISESVIITMDYVHNLMDYNDPVSQSTDPEDIPEFRNIYFKECISSDPEAYFTIKSLDKHPETVHDIFFEKCNLGTDTLKWF